MFLRLSNCVSVGEKNFDNDTVSCVDVIRYFVTCGAQRDV